MSLPNLLERVKTELDKSTAADDAAILQKIDAAWAEIADCIGHVDSVPFDRTFDVGLDGMIVLSETPVTAVTSVRLLRSDGTVATDYGPGSDVDPSGVLYGLPAGIVRIQWTAGLDPVPANVLEAAVQLAAHLFRQSRSLKEGGQIRSDVPMGPGMSSAMPNRVRELLNLRGRAPRSRVLVGGAS